MSDDGRQCQFLEEASGRQCIMWDGHYPPCEFTRARASAGAPAAQPAGGHDHEYCETLDGMRSAAIAERDTLAAKLTAEQDEHRGTRGRMDYFRERAAESRRDLAAARALAERYGPALVQARDELGVPQPGYPAPVANAARIIAGALRLGAVESQQSAPAGEHAGTRGAQGAPVVDPGSVPPSAVIPPTDHRAPQEARPGAGPRFIQCDGSIGAEDGSYSVFCQKEKGHPSPCFRDSPAPPAEAKPERPALSERLERASPGWGLARNESLLGEIRDLERQLAEARRDAEENIADADGATHWQARAERAEARLAAVERACKGEGR